MITGEFQQVDDDGPLPPPFFGSQPVFEILTLDSLGLGLLAILLSVSEAFFLRRRRVETAIFSKIGSASRLHLPLWRLDRKAER